VSQGILSAALTAIYVALVIGLGAALA